MNVVQITCFQLARMFLALVSAEKHKPEFGVLFCRPLFVSCNFKRWIFRLFWASKELDLVRFQIRPLERRDQTWDKKVNPQSEQAFRCLTDPHGI
jgi:hypothetical protein